MAIFNNTATLSYDGVIKNSNAVSGEIVENLTVTKTVLGGAYNAGDRLTYIISIVNLGSALNDITITDDLGGYAFGGSTLYPLNYVDGSSRLYVNGVLAVAPEVVAGPPLVFSSINIPEGGNAILVYEASVTAFAPMGSDAFITNTALVSNQCSSASASATAEAANGIELSISKSLSPETLACGDELTYTIVIQNSGTRSATEQDDLVVSDIFNPMLSNITVTLNGILLAENVDYTYDENTGVFETISGRITVPGAEYVQRTDGTWTISPGVAVIRVTGTV